MENYRLLQFGQCVEQLLGKRTVDSDLRMIYVNHARVQVDYSRQLDAEWNKILPNGNVGGGAGSAGEVGGVDVDGVLSKEAEMMMI